MTLFDFINDSPTPYHAVWNIAELLTAKGVSKLNEKEKWVIEAGKSYYITRNDSSIIAIDIPKNPAGGFMITASHSDSPAFKLKANPEMKVSEAYLKLNCEPYGGLIGYSWFDRPLSIAGRVIIRGENGHVKKLVNIDRDVLLIPSLAIHMNRKVNEGIKLDMQKDMLPLWTTDSDAKLMDLIADSIGVESKDILSSDLTVYVRDESFSWGLNREFISAPRLDDLECAYATTKAFAENHPKEHINVLCVFDNEEVGSLTRQGAASTFLKDVLKRISLSLGDSEEEFMIRIAKSYMISADNAHAMHPNSPETSDPINVPKLNKGIVIKHAANAKYCSDGASSAAFAGMCQEIGVPVQHFYNKSGEAGGSTLGNLCNGQISLEAVDIGLPQLAMHSAVETAGHEDIEFLVRALEYFYEQGINVL